MNNTEVVHPLVDQVQSVRPENIELPILRELVRDIQTKSSDEMQRDSQCWSDSNWNNGGNIVAIILGKRNISECPPSQLGGTLTSYS